MYIESKDETFNELEPKLDRGDGISGDGGSNGGNKNVPAITGGVPTAQSEESPEDLAPNRIHPSLRLGARVASPGGGKRKAPASSTAAKATGKRKVTKPPAPKRIPRSPCHGVSLRKVNVARSLNPPRKKLCLDKAQAGPSKTTMQTRSLLEEEGVRSTAGVGSGAGETASGSRAGKTSVSLRMIARVAAAIMPSAVSSTRPFCSL
ncbi:hypothetical protein Bca52824_063238 [Brassica carinata]|uniref:Uncharacterized protein n=1 Tax=Brassica carinata TaxID=52824 RepID=A0A8X7QIJ8_BRACI|nr:hypothetical protein Bca52824_063238 [Brassica carinata]